MKNRKHLWLLAPCALCLATILLGMVVYILTGLDLFGKGDSLARWVTLVILGIITGFIGGFAFMILEDMF